MPLNDVRVFRHEECWWIAKVLARGTAGFVGKPKEWKDSVFFQELGQEDDSLLKARELVSALNKLSHGQLVQLLKNARNSDVRLKLRPVNAPNTDESAEVRVKDSEGLNWQVRRAAGVMVTKWDGPVQADGIELTCLDDSALHGLVCFDSPDVVETFFDANVEKRAREVVEAFKRVTWPDGSRA